MTPVGVLFVSVVVLHTPLDMPRSYSFVTVVVLVLVQVLVAVLLGAHHDRQSVSLFHYACPSRPLTLLESPAT